MVETRKALELRVLQHVLDSVIKDPSLVQAVSYWAVDSMTVLLQMTGRSLDQPFRLPDDDVDRYLSATTKVKVVDCGKWFAAQDSPTSETWTLLNDEMLLEFQTKQYIARQKAESDKA